MNEDKMGLSDITTEDYLLIIDGSSLLSTQFFGNLPKEIMFAKTLEEKETYFNRIMQTKGGIYTNAVYGFLRVLLKILKEQHPAYLAVTWDVSRDTFRRELFADYKGNRGETLEPLRQQFILCQEVLKAMNIMQFMDPYYEADDFSGSIAKMFEEKIPVRIMTKDNDYLQLINERTHLWMIHSTAKKTEELYQKYELSQKKLNVPDRTFPISPKLVKEEFLIEPSSVNSLKGLMGDASDNIKGVPGVGEATAVALIAHYGSVEALYDAIRNLDESGKKKMNEFWKNELALKRSPMNYLLKESDTELVGEKAAILSKTLATIKCDIDFQDLTLEALRVNIDKEGAKSEFERLEFKSLKIEENEWQEISENPFEEENFINPFAEQGKTEIQEKQEYFIEKSSIERKNPEKIIFPPLDLNHVQYVVIDSAKGFAKLKTDVLAMIENKKVGLFTHLAFSFLVDCGIIYGIGLTFSEDKQYYLCFGKDLTSNEVIEEMKRWREMSVCLVCHRLKEQLPFLKLDYAADDTEAKNFFDVELAAYLVNPLTGEYSLAALCKEYLSWGFEGRENLLSGLTIASATAMIPKEMERAAILESAAIYHLKERIGSELSYYGMEELFYNIEMPLIFTLYDMEQRGIHVNKEQLAEYGSRLLERIVTLEKDIHELAGEEFNINSPKQLGIILFEKLKLPNGKKTKTGYSTSADVLEKLTDTHPVIQKILEYRQLTKLKSTYADGLAGYIGEDGRIHGSFNQTVTATGRISSTEPNLQNIPIRLELGRQIRKVFIPESGYVFLDADYSQIELRVLAHMSKDKRLIAAYNEAQDIHKITASQVFHTPLSEVTDEQRSNAKAVNFGIVYGISSFGLGQGLNIARQEAEEYIKKYFETYPRVKEFLDELIIQGKDKGAVFTMFGRRRPVPDLMHSNFVRRSSEERIAMNSPIQGTAADIIKIAMIKVNRHLKKEGLRSRLLLQIHDELLVEVHESEIECVKNILKEEMQQAAKLLVELEIELKQGKNWYEAK